jgi:mRNA interferase MazF
VKRGEIVVFRESGSPASKSRPCIVVQRDATLPGATKITAVPLTSALSGVGDQRPLLVPTVENGLRRISEAQVDWIFSFETIHLGPQVGEVEPEVMKQVDEALRLWLDL